MKKCIDFEGAWKSGGYTLFRAAIEYLRFISKQINHFPFKDETILVLYYPSSILTTNSAAVLIQVYLVAINRASNRNRIE